MAIHKGGGDNPHMHLMISERGLDGHARDAETWFKRANTAEPEKGGAKKTRSMMGKEWLEQTREKWEQTANQALERAGRDERISSASLQDQFWNAVEGGDEQRAQQLEHRVPGVHRGPGAEERADRGDDRAQERLATAKDIEAVNSIARLEAKLAAVVEKIRDLAERIRPRKERTDALDSRDKAAFEKGQDARGRIEPGGGPDGRGGTGAEPAAAPRPRSGEGLRTVPLTWTGLFGFGADRRSCSAPATVDLLEHGRRPGQVKPIRHGAIPHRQRFHQQRVMPPHEPQKIVERNRV